ncbi:hypothetical protein NCC49_002326 [Naganishia albida]|nr:hypothetical protein NCC49_002326 [Naganishia albida]
MSSSSSKPSKPSKTSKPSKPPKPSKTPRSGKTPKPSKSPANLDDQEPTWVDPDYIIDSPPAIVLTDSKLQIVHESGYVAKLFDPTEGEEDQVAISKLKDNREAAPLVASKAVVVWMYQTFPIRGVATTAPEDSGRTFDVADDFAKLCVGGNNPFRKVKRSQGASKPFPGKSGISAFEYVDAAGREMIELDQVITTEDNAEPHRKAVPKVIVAWVVNEWRLDKKRKME